MPSTVISNMEYDPATSTLRITYVSGIIYEYLDVPEQVYIGLKTSKTKGVYLNNTIKGNYQYKKISAA
jgi:hypothetical protein